MLTTTKVLVGVILNPCSSIVGDIIITGSKDNTCRIWKDNYFNDPTGGQQ